MGFSEAISTCYSKFLVFEGRASRSEFWYFRLFVLLANFALTILVKLFPQSANGSGPVVLMIATGFLLIVPDISVQVRRLHDRGISGLWLLPTYVVIPGIAVYSIYVGHNGGITLARTHEEALALLGIFWLGCVFFTLVASLLSGQKGANKYGADPLECKDVTVLVRTPSPITDPGQNERLDSLLESHFPRSRDALAQGSAATHSERQNIVPLPLAGADEASAILLKYNDEARAAYSKLIDYPVEWQNEYRQRLVENPSQDPEVLVGIVVLKFLGRPDLAWSSDIWDALETTRNRGKIAIDEFIKVFSLLSHTMTPAVIAQKVFDNSRGTVWYTYLVCDENEVEQKVYRYSRDVFSVEGSSETFHNIDAVYQYLNTPLSKRVKLYLLNTVQKA